MHGQKNIKHIYIYIFFSSSSNFPERFSGILSLSFVKWPERNASVSQPTNAEVNICITIPPIPQTAKRHGS